MPQMHVIAPPRHCPRCPRLPRPPLIVMLRGGRQLGVFHVAQTEQNAQLSFEIIQQNKPVFDHPANVNRTFVLLRLTPFWFVSGVCSDYSLKGFSVRGIHVRTCCAVPARRVTHVELASQAHPFAVHAHIRIVLSIAWLRLSLLSLSSSDAVLSST